MKVTGFPPSIAPGSTVCVTVTGAPGPVTASASGAAKIVSVTANTAKPATWTVCFSMTSGLGEIEIAGGGGKAMPFAVRAK